MKLSENFSLAEAEKSQTALRLNLNNKVPANFLPAIKLVAREILQPIRDHYGIPFTPSSWWRGLGLNEAIDGSNDSQHCRGEAVDFEVPMVSNREVAEWIKEHLEFDQLILEFWRPGDANAGWIHCSKVIAGTNRGEILRFDGKTYMKGLD